MDIVKVASLPNGGHENQSWPNGYAIPAGYAVIPDGMKTENFPFGNLRAENINGVMTVTSWLPLPVPEPEKEESQPTQLDIVQAQVAYTAMKTGTLINHQGGAK